MLLNERVRYNTTLSDDPNPYGRRATLAHEIAHLLVDRSGSLPLAEVLGGARTPSRAESRAGAFAAELLLPRSIAAPKMINAEEDPEGQVRVLQRTYGVSKVVVAGQAYNGALWGEMFLPYGVWNVLYEHVPSGTSTGSGTEDRGPESRAQPTGRAGTDGRSVCEGELVMTAVRLRRHSE